jgi:subtilase family serine protease
MDSNKSVTATFTEIPPEEEHDVVAVSQSASEVEVMPGDIVSIDVTVRNDGDVTETFDVTCEADGITVGTILVVDLAPGLTRTITFTWNTLGVPQGTYKIVATADPSDQIIEVDEENNVCDMPASIFVVPELPLGTIMAALSMFGALVGYVGLKRRRTK